jgi:hypothetical protein
MKEKEIELVTDCAEGCFLFPRAIVSSAGDVQVDDIMGA